ncbi:MAG: GNAT family N-acetyltransferase [Candidatus Andersenbacteria bacterium]
MFIQPLTLDDVAEVCRIGLAESAFEVSESDTFWTPDQLSKWVETGEDVLLVAKDNDHKIIGFALSTLHRPTGKATWENLYVNPTARNQGVGMALTEEMTRQLHAKGASYICFFVRAEKDDEITYFTNRGFTQGYNFVWFGKYL